jgi:type I restriction enzyme M protein
MLFLLHLISKINKPTERSPDGGRAAIVLNGSPLFNGAAKSGESKIRKWILDRDYLEAIIALPTNMFYNTDIATYIWVLDTTKAPERRGKVQLIDATARFEKMRRALGEKRKLLGADDIAWIADEYGAFTETPTSKVFDREEFYYRTITVERPLLDESGQTVRDSKGRPKPDTKLRGTENVPWNEDIDAYFDREVKPFLPDAWIDKSKTKEGCEIPFTRHFYVYTPPRPLEEIDRDLDEVLGRIRERLEQVRR